MLLYDVTDPGGRPRRHDALTDKMVKLDLRDADLRAVSVSETNYKV